MRRTVRSVMACVTAAVAVLGAPVSAGSPAVSHAELSSYPPPVPPSNPPRTAVDPLTLDRGPDPRTVYYDQRRHVIHDGARMVPAQFPGRVVKLAKVYGGVRPRQ